MELTREQIDQLLRDQKQLGDYLKALVEKNGKEATGKPAVDAIEADKVKKMTDGLLDAMESKGLFKKERKFKWGGKGEAGANEVNVSFGKYLLMAKMNHPKLTEHFDAELFRDEKIVMSGLSSAQGGYTLPTEYSDKIIGSIYDPANIIGKCTRYPQGARTKNLPKWLTGVTVCWVDEDGVKTITKPTLTYKQSVLKKIVAGPIPFADEYLEDDITDIVTGVEGLVTKAILSEIQRVILVGDVTGLGDPFNGIAYSVTGGNIVNQLGASLSYADIVACWNNASVLEDYRAGKPEWTMNRNGMGLCLNILDLNNRPIFLLNTATDGKVVMSLIGDPVNIVSSILNTYGVGADETKIIYGDFQYMLLGEKYGAAGIKVSVSNSAVDATSGSVAQNAFMQDETWYRFVMRRGILCAIPEAYSLLNKVK
jgi:HK97 family phage major capsid protein